MQIGELKAQLDELVGATARSPSELPYYLSEYNVPGPASRMQLSLASGLFIDADGKLVLDVPASSVTSLVIY